MSTADRAIANRIVLVQGDITRQATAGIDNLVPRSIVEGHEQVEARVGRGRFHDVVDATLHFGGHPIRTSDDAEADAASHELRQLAIDRPLEQAHERGDLVARAVPVL